ncbi:hypothetical protein BH09PSE4_BH09PSE4_07770 [soil metagenome]
MFKSKATGLKGARAFMSRLARDVRGNTIAIMAAALIPMAGLVGGGVDISRMYIVKTRLQHACDAGALAGRKAMGGGTWSQSGGMPNTTALRFYDANFQPNGYGSTNSTRAFAESAGVVTGTASATLPMTLMKILGKTTETIAVTCDAEMRLPNTDVMFVLDTTGSMNDIPSGDTARKIDSLKVSVKCFYEIVARLDTDAVCATGTPSGGTGSQVQIRFGFMPYATNVNVGYLLPSTYFADSWKYQSREPQYTTSGSQTTYVQTGTPTSTTTPGTIQLSYSYCNNSYASGYNNSSDAYSNNNNTKTTTANTYTIVSWSSSGGGTCKYNMTTKTTTYTKQTTTTTTFSKWHYGQINTDISDLKDGSGGWNTSFVLPIGSNGTNKTITWDGCIEERPTVRATDYDPIPSGAYDLNIDLVPTSGNANSLWGPALQQVIYTRGSTNAGNSSAFNTSDLYTTTDYAVTNGYFCPPEAKKLQAWSDANEFDDYVDSLTPEGNTYHDIGLLWGARFMSGTGIFASENALTPQGGEIQRHMIFMTDGDACTGVTNYQAYGIAWYDRRQTSTSSAPTDGCTSTGSLTQQVNYRTEALCTAIKNKNITLWVITFGYVDPTTVTRMTNCASDGKYFSANNAAQLQTTFASIANQISQLRLTK